MRRLINYFRKRVEASAILVTALCMLPGGTVILAATTFDGQNQMIGRFFIGLGMMIAGLLVAMGIGRYLIFHTKFFDVEANDQ